MNLGDYFPFYEADELSARWRWLAIRFTTLINQRTRGETSLQRQILTLGNSDDYNRRRNPRPRCTWLLWDDTSKVLFQCVRSREKRPLPLCFAWALDIKSTDICNSLIYITCTVYCIFHWLRKRAEKLPRCTESSLFTRKHSSTKNSTELYQHSDSYCLLCSDVKQSIDSFHLSYQIAYQLHIWWPKIMQ